MGRRIVVAVYPPDGLHLFKNYTSVANVDVEDCVRTAGTRGERFAFRRGHETLKAILVSLQEIECSTRIYCSVLSGGYALEGSVSLWHEEDRLIAEHAIALLYDQTLMMVGLHTDSASTINFTLKRVLEHVRS